CQQYSALPRTF
nr:immunoglobulin light chain junction region [Macaca mulatta]